MSVDSDAINFQSSNDLREMKQVNDILTLHRTKAKIDAVSKKRLLEILAEVFANDIASFDIENLYQSLIGREKLGTTGIGEGIAIPHCRFNTEGLTYCAVLSLSTPIDFDAVDGKPVDIIIAMLVPENAESAHLELLASLAESLQNQKYVSELREAKDDASLFEVATRED